MSQEAMMTFWTCYAGSGQIRFDGRTKSDREIKVFVPIDLIAKLGDAATRWIESKVVLGEGREAHAGHLFYHIEKNNPFPCSTCEPAVMRGPVTPSGICPIDGDVWEKHDELALGNHAKRMWKNDDLPKDWEGE